MLWIPIPIWTVSFYYNFALKRNYPTYRWILSILLFPPLFSPSASIETIPSAGIVEQISLSFLTGFFHHFIASPRFPRWNFARFDHDFSRWERKWRNGLPIDSMIARKRLCENTSARWLHAWKTRPLWTQTGFALATGLAISNKYQAANNSASNSRFSREFEKSVNSAYSFLL